MKVINYKLIPYMPWGCISKKVNRSFTRRNASLYMLQHIQTGVPTGEATAHFFRNTGPGRTQLNFAQRQMRIEMSMSFLSKMLF